MKASKFCLDGGVLLEPWNPYPSLRVILAGKGIRGFFVLFCFFICMFFLSKKANLSQFLWFLPCKHLPFGKVDQCLGIILQEMDLMFRDFLWKRKCSRVAHSCMSLYVNRFPSSLIESQYFTHYNSKNSTSNSLYFENSNRKCTYHQYTITFSYFCLRRPNAKQIKVILDKMFLRGLGHLKVNKHMPKWAYLP